MSTQGPETTRAIIYSRLWSLAGPFLPESEVQVDLVKNVLTPIGAAVVNTPVVGKSRVDHALILLESSERTAKDPMLPLRGVATLLRQRIHPLRAALTPEGLIHLFKGAAEGILEPLRRKLFIERGNEGIDYEEARRLAEEGDLDYRTYHDLMTLTGKLGELLPPSSPAASAV